MLRRLLTISVLSLLIDPRAALAKGSSLSCLDQQAEALQTSKLMGALLSFPTIPYMIGDKDGMVAFVPTSDVFSAVLGTPKSSVIINHVEELRFLPNTLAKASVLLVLNSAEGFTAEDAAKAAAAASELDLSLSLVWLADEGPSQHLVKIIKDARGLLVERDELMRKVLSYGCPAV